MKFKTYAKYKDTGVEWLGEIPEHWNVIRLKYAASINDETLSENTDPDFEFLYVDIGSVDSVKGIQEKDFMRFETSPSRARRIVSEGDVIVSTVRTYLRAIAPIDEVDGNLIVSTGFAVIRPKNIIKSKFAAYALRAPYFVDCVVANSVGVSYQKGLQNDYDRALCLIQRDVLGFVYATQPKKWEKLKNYHGADVKERFLKRLSSEISKRGALDVFIKGFKDSGCRFRLAFFRPSSGLNEEIQQLYGRGSGLRN